MSTEESAAGRRRFRRGWGASRLLHAAWTVGCLAALTVLIGARWLRYTTWSSAPAADRVLREVMVVDTQAFLWPWAYTRAELPILLLATLVVVVGMHRRLGRALVRRDRGMWRLTPLAMSLLLGGAVWVHYLFDLNPTVAAACATSLGLAWLMGRRAAAHLPARLRQVVWTVFFAAWLFVAADVVDRITIVVWAIVLLASHRLLAPRIGGRELAIARVLTIVPMNLLSATLPLAWPMHGGTYLGDELAYSFCETADQGSLYVSVPVCDSVRHSYEDCRAGHVAQYDMGAMTRVAEHRFFDPGFYGRLEQLACLPDEIQVAVQAAVHQGQSMLLSVLSFPISTPDRFNPLVTRDGLGATIAYDKGHDAVFYSSEFSDLVMRYDRRRKRFDNVGGSALRHDWFQPVALQAYTGSLSLNTGSIHPARNRIYLVEWMQGRYAYAVDLTSLRVVARYDVGAGGALGIAVDPERDRLFVSSLWGLEVFDLTTDRLIARKRMGLGNRPVIVDGPRDRLYVSSTVEGKVRILDRDTFELLGQIPVGIGSRYPYLSADGRRLFASSAAAHYYWDAGGLARRP